MRAAWAMVREEQGAGDPFWITGLPRSRTAWFSVAMRGPRSHCFHELTADASSFEEMTALWLVGEPGQHRGNSDSACGFHAERILTVIRPRTLVIERPVGEVIASLSSLFERDMRSVAPMLERLQDSLNFEHPLIKRVRFADLNDRDALIEAAEWLVPGHGERAAGLMDLNIQVTKSRAQELTGLTHSLWHLKEAA
jgi:hypothetical protein